LRLFTQKPNGLQLHVRRLENVATVTHQTESVT